MPSLVGVLDVGSFSTRLVVVDRQGTPLDPVLTHKTRLRLDRALDERGRIDAKGVASIAAAVGEANRFAAEHGVGQVYPLATSSVRDAPNAEEVVAEVCRTTGTRLRFLTGAREAELSFVAARRWYGAAAGSLLVLDIGGGTVEIAAGAGERATFARSLRLGARTMTRGWQAGGPTGAKRVASLREHAMDQVDETLSGLPKSLRRSKPVGCSKVFQQLARLAGARPRRKLPELRLDDLRKWIPRLAVLSAKRRAELPGISRCRAEQALAGAIVAEALLTACGGQVSISPWSTTEGLLLTLLDSPDLRAVGTVLDSPDLRAVGTVLDSPDLQAVGTLLDGSTGGEAPDMA